jgi:hypothetical protein
MAVTQRDLFWYGAGIASVLVVLLLVHALNGNPASVAVTTEAAHETVSPDGGSGSTAGAGSTQAGSMDEVLARLESRMASQGGSDADWELLAQTYEFVGRTADAKRARAHQLPPGVEVQQTPSPAAAATAAITSVTGAVELSGTLKSNVPDGLTLFIVAKSTDSAGPPVAIIRTTTGRWPLAFTLDDSNAMLPGRNLSSAQHVTVEARVSRSGMATPQAGDFASAVATIDPGKAKPVRIVIDHVIS